MTESTPFNILYFQGFIFPVPTWARWLAMDADGSWYVYEAEPKAERLGSLWTSWQQPFQTIPSLPKSNNNWRTELYQLDIGPELELLSYTMRDTTTEVWREIQ